MSSPQREPVCVWVDDKVRVEAAEDVVAEGGAGNVRRGGEGTEGGTEEDDETAGTTGAENVIRAAERPRAEEDGMIIGITEAEVDTLEGDEYEGLTFHLLTICVYFKDG